MILVDQIVEAALDDNQPVSSILRKCLVLAHQLKNTELAAWAECELDGYFDKEKGEFPTYRVIRAQAKGLLIGPFQSIIRDQPIPPAILKAQHRHFAETVWLNQPIASYDLRESRKGKGKLVMEWPPDLTLIYQNKIIEGYGLNRAYQDIPDSCIVGLIDTVRNRVLKLMLKLKDQPGADEGNKLDAIPKDTVRQFVTNIIYGGQNVISSTTRDIQQMGNINIGKGDLSALKSYLADLGVSEIESHSLEAALAADAKSDEGSKQIGNETKSWLERFGGAGLKVSREIAVGMITAVVCKYLGIA